MDLAISILIPLSVKCTAMTFSQPEIPVLGLTIFGGPFLGQEGLSLGDGVCMSDDQHPRTSGSLWGPQKGVGAVAEAL